MMNSLFLGVGLGLVVLWILALISTGVATAWFTWLVFVAACLLVMGAIGNMAAARRHPDKFA